MIEIELGKFGGSEFDYRIARRKSNALADGDLFDSGCERCANRSRREIADRDGDINGGVGGVVVLEGGDDLGVADLEALRDAERDGLPDAAVAVADAGNPVPTLGGDEGGAVERLKASVFAGPAEDGLLLRDAGVGRRRDAHGEDIVLAGLEHGGDVEAAAAECALYRAKLFTVEPDGGGVVDAFEGEFCMCPGG